MMNERIKEQLTRVANSLFMLELSMSDELKGKAFDSDSTEPLRALEEVREALLNLRKAQQKLDC
jgi:two-component sensor histidine kinase